MRIKDSTFVVKNKTLAFGAGAEETEIAGSDLRIDRFFFSFLFFRFSSKKRARDENLGDIYTRARKRDGGGLRV